MLININNYSLSRLTDEDLDMNSKLGLRQHSGCNGFVKNNTSKYLYLAIPKVKVDEVLKEVYNNTKIEYTLDNVINLFKEMGFDYEYIFKDEETIFQDGTYKGYYLFKIEKKSNHIVRYYAFCMVRHFYYAQDILITYLSLYHKLNTDLEKIIVLSIIARFQSQYSFVYNKIPLINNLTFKILLSEYIKYRHNNTPEGISSNATDFSLECVYNNMLIIKNMYIANVENYSIFNTNDEEKTLFKDYIINNLKIEDTEFYNLNIDFKYLDKLRNGYHKVYSIPGGYIHANTIRANEKILIPKKPIKLNINKKSLFTRKLILEPITPKIVINVDKITKDNYDCKVLNTKQVITNLKNRKNLFSLCSQTENYDFPFKLVRSIKTKNDSEIVINNSDELESFKSSENIKKYIKQPYLKNIKKHYLFFTKDELFLYQVKLEDSIIDNSCSNITNYMLPHSSEVVSRCHELFKNSGLDIGVVVLDVDLNANTYAINDITSFVSNGAYASSMYINQIDKVINQIEV